MEKEAKKLDKTILTLKGCNSAFKSQFKKYAHAVVICVQYELGFNGG